MFLITKVPKQATRGEDRGKALVSGCCFNMEMNKMAKQKVWFGGYSCLNSLKCKYRKKPWDGINLVAVDSQLHLKFKKGEMADNLKVAEDQ